MVVQRNLEEKAVGPLQPPVLPLASMSLIRSHCPRSMHRFANHFLPLGRKVLIGRRSLLPLAIISLLFLGVSQIISPSFNSHIPFSTSFNHRMTTAIDYEELERAEIVLRQQLKRIKDVENWRLLGDLQSTGEDLYMDPKTQEVLTNEAKIAFFLQVAQSNIALAPRLLSRIWHPDNIYCIHFDTKIPMKQSMMFERAIRSNGKLSNVIIFPSAPITYTGISMLLNTLESMHALLKGSPSWDYYINLSGSDYPMVSATGLRRLLGRADVLNSSLSFVGFSQNRALWDKLAMHRLGRLHFDPALGFDHASDKSIVETRAIHPVLREGNLRIPIPKGEAWIIGHRSFCESAAHGNVARRLLALFANMQSSPEHFFQTLSWNHKLLNKTVVRHSFRDVFWSHNGRKAIQHPFYLDGRSKDGKWEMWDALAHSPNFFARKFRVPDSTLMDHIDVQKSGATRKTANLTAVSESFGIVQNRFSCVTETQSAFPQAHIMPCFWKGWRERECKPTATELCVGGFAEPPR